MTEDGSTTGPLLNAGHVQRMCLISLERLALDLVMMTGVDIAVAQEAVRASMIVVLVPEEV